MQEEITTEEFLADLGAAKKRVESLQQSNVSKVNALAQLGKGIDLTSLANVKIDLFLEMFLDEGSKLLYLYNLEAKLKPMLDQALSQARQEQIANPGVNSKVAGIKQGLILPR